MAPIPTHILNGQQFDNVDAFKRRFSAEGGLYREFQTEEELRGILNRLFEQIASSAGTPSEAPTKSASDEPRGEGQENLIESDVGLDDLSDIGILDLNDQLTMVVDEQTTFLDGWNEALNSNTEEARSASNQMEELTRFGAADPSALRPIMSRLASNLNMLSKFVEENVGGYIDRNNRIIALTEAGLDLSGDFPDQENASSMRESVVELLSTLVENKTSLGQLIATTRGLPRMTTEFNRAKKRAVKAEETMLAEVDRLLEKLTLSLSSYDAQPASGARV